MDRRPAHGAGGPQGARHRQWPRRALLPEAGLDAITAQWFEDVRAAPPGPKREIEDWGALFTAVGPDPQGTRSFLLDLPAPLSGPALDHVVAEISRRRGMFGQALSAEDIAVPDRLLDPDDPAGLRHRPDVFLLMARTVHPGRKDRPMPTC
ncbi:hypothetical protein [Streptomyces sp. NPDC093149]|uniref:hypothetical protein n=1 Tax=Streptomyces sp. NPDC093149 TaxID=3366031 RepID=UPI0038174031